MAQIKQILSKAVVFVREEVLGRYRNVTITGVGFVVLVIVLSLLNSEQTPVTISPTTKITPTPAPKNEDLVDQAKLDVDYGNAVKALYRAYPWYSSLPIDTKEYVVIYDFEKKSFRIIIKMAETAGAAQKDSAMKGALDSIRKIGADPDKETYYTVFRP